MLPFIQGQRAARQPRSNPGSPLRVKEKKAEDCIKTRVEVTTHTVPTVDGRNYVGFDFVAVNDLCRLYRY